METLNTWARVATATTGLALALSLAGCMSGPDYARPDIAMPDAYHAQATAAADRAPAADLAQWWAGFRDPVLDGLIQRALAQSLDLAAAQARVAQARAAAGEAATAWLPQGALDGSVSRERQSTVGPLGTIASQSPGYDRNQTVRTLGAGASWELDLAGGLHRRAEALRAQADAAEAAHMGVRISIAAETADAYFQLRGAQAALVLMRAQVDTDTRYVAVMEDRMRQGVALDRDRDDAVARLRQDDALLPPLRAQVEKQGNRLDVLLGDSPGADVAGVRRNGSPADAAALPKDFSVTWTLPGIPGSLQPSALLRRRPDVVAAERRLAAATAGIGAALAQYYPDVSLSGLLGFERLGDGNLFSSQAFQPAALAGLHWRLFDFGRVDAEVAQARGAQAEAWAAYRQAVLRASEDAENALVTLAQVDDQAAALQGVLAASTRAKQSAQRGYGQGTASMVEILLREREVLQSRRAWVLADVDRARATVDAYRSLGGGWNGQDAQVGQGAGAGVAGQGGPEAQARPDAQRGQDRQDGPGTIS
ncbi:MULTISPECIES: efflux transporter outer membrane subunit [unclassified Achromobacter]|uniref:efflux transporter outer membrane subunit n=1 Tax=unclassified Achromobacter TaxID=2626865 RepID=UPI000B518947|nr:MULTISPECIES: TolC family protein [unclassified Achromobacter]OWT75759.1 RND transporter [Achromobacter sp. HZ28]OWT76419.1 RND transporter [Achromobacter sp. HZ34]